MTSKLRNDGPVLCILFGMLFTFCALGLLFPWQVNLVLPEDLVQVSGIVREIQYTNPPNGAPKIIHIYLGKGSSSHHLIQDDLSWKAPGLSDVRVGESVVAYVDPDPLLNRYWLWGLERYGKPLLSYQEVLTEKLRWYENARPLAYMMLGSGIILLFAGVLNWKRSGVCENG